MIYIEWNGQKDGGFLSTEGEAFRELEVLALDSLQDVDTKLVHWERDSRRLFIENETGKHTYVIKWED